MNDAKMPSVAVITADGYLYRKICLELHGCANCNLQTDTEGDADIYLLDERCGLKMDGAITMGTQTADIVLPFAIGSLRKRIVHFTSSGVLTLSSEEKCARIFGRSIKLTDVEFALLLALYKRGGEYVSRDTILEEVWDKSTDKGVINVYVHYLREKLEGGEERIILSSRNLGYAINQKYLGGAVNDQNN